MLYYVLEIQRVNLILVIVQGDDNNQSTKNITSVHSLIYHNKIK